MLPCHICEKENRESIKINGYGFSYLGTNLSCHRHKIGINNASTKVNNMYMLLPEYMKRLIYLSKLYLSKLKFLNASFWSLLCFSLFAFSKTAIAAANSGSETTPSSLTSTIL